VDAWNLARSGSVSAACKASAASAGIARQRALAEAASVGHSTYRGSRRDGNNPASSRGHNNPEENHRAAFAIDTGKLEAP
jgi:hypothetical protein